MASHQLRPIFEANEAILSISVATVGTKSRLYSLVCLLCLFVSFNRFKLNTMFTELNIFQRLIIIQGVPEKMQLNFNSYLLLIYSTDKITA